MRAPVYRSLEAKNTVLGLAFPTEFTVVLSAWWAGMISAGAFIGSGIAVASYVLTGRLRPAGPVLPRQVLWLYLLPLAVACVIGMPHVRAIPAFFYAPGRIPFPTARQTLTFFQSGYQMR